MQHPAFFTAARVLVGCMFVYSGTSKLMNFSATVRMMQGYRFPVARAALVLAIVWELGWAGVMIVGVHLLLSGVALIFFVLLATAMVHVQDAATPERRPMALVHIGNNLTVVGGLLAIAAH